MADRRGEEYRAGDRPGGAGFEEPGVSTPGWRGRPFRRDAEPRSDPWSWPDPRPWPGRRPMRGPWPRPDPRSRPPPDPWSWPGPHSRPDRGRRRPAVTAIPSRRGAAAGTHGRRRARGPAGRPSPRPGRRPPPGVETPGCSKPAPPGRLRPSKRRGAGSGHPWLSARSPIISGVCRGRPRCPCRPVR